jgi:exonuclease III
MLKGWQMIKREKRFFTGYMEKISIYIFFKKHSSNENVKNFQDDWEGRCLFSNKNTASGGVMIVFNTIFEYKLENVITDSDGRYLICTIVVNNEQIVLGNYYGLNSDELYPLEDFCSKVNQFDDLPMILGGDWNMVMDKIDKKGGSLVLTHKKNRERLRQFIDRNELVDIWRICNPIEQRYSWRQRSPAVHCRLDFFLVSVGLGNINRKTDISYGFKSDHSFISLENDKQNLKRGKGFYKFNTSLLLDSTFKEKLQKLIPEKG